MVKPDITFFGESLGNRVTTALQADRRRADLLLVMGTSLQVAPMSHVCKLLPRDRPQVLINKQSVRLRPELSDGFDVELLGNADDVVAALSAELGWNPAGDATPAVPTSPRPADEHPRVHLFPGAVWVPPDQHPARSAPPVALEGVSCDVCGTAVDGQFFSCDECLWFDVCAACYTRDCGSARGCAGPTHAATPTAPWRVGHKGHAFSAQGRADGADGYK